VPVASFANEVVDTGSYEIYQDQKALGVEVFAFERASDSLFVHSEVTLKFSRSDGDVDFEKTMRLLANEFDGELLLYESTQHLNGKKLVRAIVPNDTSMTVYREGDDLGEGNTLVRPTGRMFIVDPQVFVLFDVICRDVAGREFTKRPITMFVLAGPDTTVEGMVTHLGKETIRWGAKPVQTTKISIADSASEFFAWIGPRGHMLLLTQPTVGLRVTRKAPDVKPPGSR